MSTTASYKTEASAYAELARVFDHANKAAELFRAAGLVLPDALVRLLGADAGAGMIAAGRTNRLIHTPPPPHPTRPPSADKSWIWVKRGDLSMLSLGGIVLKEA